ncbi:hypothetical protein ACHAP5_012044 [Fusarium lateritium]
MDYKNPLTPQKKKELKCYVCHKTGHVSNNCPKQLSAFHAARQEGMALLREHDEPRFAALTSAQREMNKVIEALRKTLTSSIKELEEKLLNKDKEIEGLQARIQELEDRNDFAAGGQEGMDED